MDKYLENVTSLITKIKKNDTTVSDVNQLGHSDYICKLFLSELASTDLTTTNVNILNNQLVAQYDNNYWDDDMISMVVNNIYIADNPVVLKRLNTFLNHRKVLEIASAEIQCYKCLPDYNKLIETITDKFESTTGWYTFLNVLKIVLSDQPEKTSTNKYTDWTKVKENQSEILTLLCNWFNQFWPSVPTQIEHAVTSTLEKNTRMPEIWNTLDLNTKTTLLTVVYKDLCFSPSPIVKPKLETYTPDKITSDIQERFPFILSNDEAKRLQVYIHLYDKMTVTEDMFTSIYTHKDVEAIAIPSL